MTTFAIVGAGGMGAALAARLTAHGARVVTWLAGRSPASQARAAAAGMETIDEAGLGEAELVLSVVPPDQALPLAERLAPTLAAAARMPVYVDCNAVSPETSREIESAIAGHRIPFADAGIIGLPPQPDKPGPTIYVSGPFADRVTALNAFGLKVTALQAENGAASALKMSYAGITKGLIALAATMALAAERAGVAEALKAELAHSQAPLAAGFARSIPDMLGKARRWVPEMKEISAFVGTSRPESGAYRAFAELYDAIAQADPATLAVLRSVYSNGKLAP